MTSLAPSRSNSGISTTYRVRAMMCTPGLIPRAIRTNAARRRGVGDRGDEHAGPLDPQRAQDLLPRRVAVEGRLSVGPRLAHRLRVQLDDEVGCRDGPERGRKVAAVQSVPGDDDVIRQRLLARRDLRGTKPR